MPRVQPAFAAQTTDVLQRRYQQVRTFTEQLAAPLSAEDSCVQSMPDASPAKWHLAHTSWFFETFLLKPNLPGYREFHPQYAVLFNSYYNAVGAMHPRPQRGLLTRPPLAEVLAYRRHVDAALQRFIENDGLPENVQALIELGLNHEQQHQELLLTDIKHLFSLNPLQPAYTDTAPEPTPAPPALAWIEGPQGRHEFGDAGEGFCFDNERPRHVQWLHPHAIASRPVTNGEYQAFVRDGGYQRPELWLSDGWVAVQTEGWQRPLYWSEDLAAEFTLAGPQALDVHAPVTHLSYYEADAYARWAGARLPTEFEWEAAAVTHAVNGNFVDGGRLRPGGAVEDAGRWFGDVWEWTASDYAPYPGYAPAAGAVGEYNGKFMCNQRVLRGGSCATAQSHTRASYRNFFYPQARWQFSGLRLARDLS
jgi:ergothioneine biosynthesis protein EgtB